MTAKDTFAEREKREIDRQLDEELEGTFPASDPPKITRFSAKSPSVADRTRGTFAYRRSEDGTYQSCDYESSAFIACQNLPTTRKIPQQSINSDGIPLPTEHFLREWERNMAELTGLEPQYDAFLFAPVCEAYEMTLSVLSLLARQDVDPWQEAARLAQLSKQPCCKDLEIE